jgi:trehalose/maltose hydrolase-like predicted phosphorylase
MIPSAESLAKEKGAVHNALLITEAHDFDGRQVSKTWSNMDKNYTPASQIASLFWDYYEFTGDRKYLQDTAYPFMKKAANFYQDKLQWDSVKNEYYQIASLYESASIDEVKNPSVTAIASNNFLPIASKRPAS